MPDLSAMLVRRSVGELSGDRQCCSTCRRTPLAGERMHETDVGRVLCELCIVGLPEADRQFVKVERVHASEHHLRVAPRAAA